MKKHRTNSFSTLVFYMLEIGLPYCIAIPLMIFILGGDKYTAKDVLSTIPLTFFGMLGMAVLFSSLNLLTLPFKKPSVIFEDDDLLYKETRVEYCKVDKIVINSGVIRKYTRFEPCTLELYSQDTLLTEIKSPSFFMIFALMRRCKGAKLRYRNITRALLILLLTVGLCFVIATVG